MTQDYYPEQLGVLHIVNTPWVFKGVYNLCKGWIDEKTRAKFNLHGSDFKKILLESVDID